MATLTVHQNRLRVDDTAMIARTETMIAHLERLGENALKLAIDEDCRRDETCAEWLTATVHTWRPPVETPVAKVAQVRQKRRQAQGTHEWIWRHYTAGPIPGRPLTRDCLECREKDGMQLQTPLAHFMTLYACAQCGTMLTIPPPGRPW